MKFIEAKGIRVFCEGCQDFRTVVTTALKTDHYNAKPWTDLMCKKCKLVIATIEADEPGICNIELIPDSIKPEYTKGE